MKYFIFLTIYLITLPLSGLENKPLIEVWKDPLCGCCQIWAEHMQKNGYRVKIYENGNYDIQEVFGVPEQAFACHSSIINGYLVEGHVPAAYIDYLVREKPDIKGLLLPGMPWDSPGMGGYRENKQESFTVYSWAKDGSIQPLKLALATQSTK